MKREDCTNCNGWGHVLHASLTAPSEELDKSPCEVCDGTGRVGGGS